MEVQSRTSDKSPRRPTVRATRNKQSRRDLRPLPLPLPLWGVILGILGVARPMLRTKNPVKSLNEKPQDFGRELVAPTEFEPVFQSRSRFRYLTRHVEEHLPLRNTTRLKHAACTTPMIHNHSAVKSGRGPLSAAGRAPHRRHRASISGHCATRGTGCPRAWRIPIARISLATPSTLSSTPSSANSGAPPAGSLRPGRRTRPAPLCREGVPRVPHLRRARPRLHAAAVRRLHLRAPPALLCKRRGFCPSCGGRRMAERAAYLVEAQLGCPSWGHGTEPPYSKEWHRLRLWETPRP